MIKVSVIVPIYNTEKYLPKCLDSLLGQTLDEIEIIAVDDGSSDKSPQILDEYALKYSKIKAFHITNSGVANARNFGITKASGNYIAFLDSDDYVDKDIYEKMYEKTADNVDVVECDFIWEKDNKRIYDKLNLNENELLRIRAVVWNRLYRKDLFEKYDLTFPLDLYYEDVEFCYKLFPYIKTFEYVPDTYVHYVQREGSITSEKSKKLRDIYEVLNHTITFYKENNFYELYKDELEYLYMRYILGSSFKRIVKIPDKKIRKEMLKEGYNKLIDTYPNYRQNKYLKIKSKKNLYFRTINKFTYKIYSIFFHLIYS